jgi:stearoyl-CoA desaturase (delta-9 desaturase)
MARHGHRWWEIDMTFGAVRLLQALGLAWDVVDNQHKKKT